MRIARPTLKRLVTICGLILMAFAPGRAHAVFHLMQIEQVIGGVCGDPAVQAIQLRMRAGGQNLVSGTELVAYDATGVNPVVLLVFPLDVSIGQAGSRVLSVSADYAGQHPPLADFEVTVAIPESYLPAGRITFEDDGEILWSLAWGGDAYTGPTTGELDNDDDGDFGPPFPGPLPSASSQALQFQGDFSDESTTNAADYALTAGDALFTNNIGASSAVAGCVFGDGFETGDTSLWSGVIP